MLLGLVFCAPSSASGLAGHTGPAPLVMRLMTRSPPVGVIEDHREARRSGQGRFSARGAAPCLEFILENPAHCPFQHSLPRLLGLHPCPRRAKVGLGARPVRVAREDGRSQRRSKASEADG